jgi:hypothetical protein
MPTIKQRVAFNEVVGNGGNVTKAMIVAKYSPNTANTPQKLTESTGFQELCNEYGLTDDFLVKALVSDIKKKPKNRKPELELAFKIKQRLKENEPVGNTTNIVFLPMELMNKHNVTPSEPEQNSIIKK